MATKIKGGGETFNVNGKKTPNIKAQLRIKARGPNVGLKRAKVGKTVGKNHWDRLLHPWQRELEQVRRRASERASE